MKIIVKPLILFVLVISVSLTARAVNKTSRIESNLDRTSIRKALNDDIVRTEEWTVYKELSAVRIEYRFQECNSTVQGGYKNLNVVFFRLTNLTKKTLEVSWVNEYHFDGECTNCDKLDSEEYAVTVTLDPKEVKEGNCDSRDGGLSISANFIKLSPGMSGTKLTNFNLVNLEAKVIK